MSTIKKIGIGNLLPSQYRANQKARRRSVGLVSFAAGQLMKQGRTLEAVRTAALADRLDAVRRAPNLTGTEKDAIFRVAAQTVMQAAA